MKITINSAPNGNNTFADKLSKSENKFGEMAQNILTITESISDKRTDLRLPNPNWDFANETKTSNNDIEDVIAAITSNEKKTIDIICPPTI